MSTGAEALWHGLVAKAAQAGHTLHRGPGDTPVYSRIDDDSNRTTWLTDIVGVQRAVALLGPSMVMPIEPARTDSALDLTPDGHALRVADALIRRASKP